MDGWMDARERTDSDVRRRRTADGRVGRRVTGVYVYVCTCGTRGFCLWDTYVVVAR
jgi:hypothetical protein